MLCTGAAFGAASIVSPPSDISRARSVEKKLLVARLKKCSKTRNLEQGKRIHSDAAARGADLDNFVACSLMNMYAKCGIMVAAQLIFDGMQIHDVALWNALIWGYAVNQDGEAALELFESMICSPDSQTIVAGLKAIAAVSIAEKTDCKKLVKMKAVEKAMAVHSQACFRSLDDDLFVANTLVDLYAKCGSLADATNVFDRMVRRDEVSWNTMLLGYAENEQPELALKLLICMEAQEDRVELNSRSFVAAIKACSCLAVKEVDAEDGGFKLVALEKGMAVHSLAAQRDFESNIFVASSLVDMYAKCRSLFDARRVFDRMQVRNAVSWTALIFGYAENGEERLALEFFDRMMREDGCGPEPCTFAAALKACGCLAALEIGRNIHIYIRECGLEGDRIVVASLVDFYSKCGSMSEAEEVICALEGWRNMDLVIWSALIAGYSRQGNTARVIQLFDEMREAGLKPDAVTFLSVMVACSRAGLVELGKKYFEMMSSSEHSIEAGVEHYHCLVDLLSRANRLEEAVSVVRAMPYEATRVSWTTILGACFKWKNAGVGRIAFEELVGFEGETEVAYVLMGNIYGSLGMWKQKQELRSKH